MPAYRHRAEAPASRDGDQVEIGVRAAVRRFPGHVQRVAVEDRWQLTARIEPVRFRAGGESGQAVALRPGACHRLIEVFRDRVASIPAVPYPQVLQRRASRRYLNRSAGHHPAARETPALAGHLAGRKQNVTATANSPAQNADSARLRYVLSKWFKAHRLTGSGLLSFRLAWQFHSRASPGLAQISAQPVGVTKGYPALGGGHLGVGRRRWCRVTAPAQDLPWATVSHSELAAM